MKNRLLHPLFALAVCAVLAGLSVGSAMAQAVKVTSDKLSFDDLLSPEFSGSAKQKPFKPKDWLEVEVKLKVEQAGKSKVLERMTVKWYVLVKNPDRAGRPLLLTKEVEHMNIPLDEDIYCSVYLSPVSIKRLTGFDRAGKGAVEAVGYEILVNGEKVAQDTTKFKVGWWNATDKISRSDTVPLLNKAETPFNAMWWDRYAEVAPSGGSSSSSR